MRKPRGTGIDGKRDSVASEMKPQMGFYSDIRRTGPPWVLC